MRTLGIVVSAVLVAILLWFGVWYIMMRPHVARVNASIDYQYRHLREVNPTMSLKADAVYATGFPFRFMVAVEGATLSMVDGEETFAVEIPKLTLESSDAASGRYRVSLPTTIEALYAKNGAAPEHYIVTADRMPQLMLAAGGEAAQPCGPFAVGPCGQKPAKDAPFMRYAVSIPKSITLHMELGGEARDSTFELSPVELNIAIFQDIPSDLSRPLQLFVGVLREALVFKTK